MSASSPAAGYDVFIVDDHRLLIDMWIFQLQNYAEFRVKGFASSGFEALEKLATLKPEILLMDLDLPDVSGMELLRIVHERFPSLKIIVISGHQELVLVKTVLQNGARGYISKQASAAETIEGIRQVAMGRHYISREVNLSILTVERNGQQDKLSLFRDLTSREMEIITYIAEGLSSPEIAERLFISRRTVNVHRYNIFKKLDIKNSFELVELYRKYNRLSLL